MYADDTTIYFNLEDFSGIIVEEYVSNELNKVNSCLSLNKFSLNTDKTKCMTFHTRQKKFSKFLGIMFDEHLTWKNHITMITNKLSKVIGILNRLKIFALNRLYSPYIIPYFYPI